MNDHQTILSFMYCFYLLGFCFDTQRQTFKAIRQKTVFPICSGVGVFDAQSLDWNDTRCYDDINMCACACVCVCLPLWYGITIQIIRYANRFLFLFCCCSRVWIWDAFKQPVFKSTTGVINEMSVCASALEILSSSLFNIWMQQEEYAQRLSQYDHRTKCYK